MTLHTGPPARDAHLLGFGPDDVETAVKTFREICLNPADDGVAFDPDSVKGSIIRKEAGYGGVRIDIPAKLDGARIALQVDIGFGDAVTPAPQAVSYPVLLDDTTLDPSEVRSAIEATFDRRKMPMPTTVPIGFSNTFAGDATKQTQWKAFLKKNQLDPIVLSDVVNRLRGKFQAAGVI